MSTEYAGKRPRGSGDGRTAAAFSPANTSAMSSSNLESMLKQALGRIDSLERQHEEIKTSMECGTAALMDDIVRLEGENKAIKASVEKEINALKDDTEALKSENKALKWSLHRLASKVKEDWEYPVAIQPDEYWRNKGYDNIDIVLLKARFFGELKAAVSSLEHGVCDFITIGIADHDDEDLVPHWHALFRSFQHINPYGAGVKLNMHSIEINEEVMQLICSNLRRRNISQVAFANNGFTNLRNAITELGKALQSPNLKSLTWVQNPIESTEDMNVFTRVLSQSDAVDEFMFRGNCNENAQALLSSVDFSTYKVLGLCYNSLQTNGRTDIPDLIATNPPLKSLHLRSNRLNDDDAVLIAQSLGGNTNLSELDVSGNDIQERGMRALYEAVNDTSTLNALSDSNHSCLLEGLTEDFDLEGINESVQHGSQRLHMNRMCKVHKRMVQQYHNGGIVPHLNIETSGDNSVLLAPFVIESVVRRHDAFPEPTKSFECSLGLLYELVKDWKMAELLSFR